MYTTFFVSKLLISKEFKEEQPANIKLISMTDEVEKLFISNSER